MRILHYSLGFPPYRSGGMTKFCMDLMQEQIKEGNDVALLWPGQMKFFSENVSIRNRNADTLYGIKSFEIINPLPIPFDEGISAFEEYVKDSGTRIYENFLNEFQPDVIHIHTLMGLHKSFLKTAKDKNIRLVFTAHDFFPICPKVTMFRHGAICDSVQECENCGVCNTTALSITKIKILQSPVYRALKDSPIVKKLRKQHRDEYLSEASADIVTESVGSAADYKELRDYYYSLLKLMDVVHYNSSVTKKVYEAFFDLPNSCVVGITHSDIKDNRRIREYPDGQLHIRYLGPQGGAKGFFFSRRHLMNYGVSRGIFA